MFTYVDSGNAEISSVITLSADANSKVNSPTCSLSTKSQIASGVKFTDRVYTNECEFTFQVEAFIDDTSFGTYTSFKYIVRNECFNLDFSSTASGKWQVPTEDVSDPIKPLDPQLRNNKYVIWSKAEPYSLYLPRLNGSLKSETLELGY